MARKMLVTKTTITGDPAMTSLFERLAKSFRQTGGTVPTATGLWPANGATASLWDEVLMASSYDEYARMYLDYLGPRR